MFKKSVRDKINKYVKSNYQKLSDSDFELGEINYTFRCHLNAVQKVREEKVEKVYSCIAIDKENGWLCVHFINKTKEGKFVDNTWGWMQQHYDYYLIREIQSHEQDHIWKLLTGTKEMLINLHSNWFQRLFIGKIDSFI